MIEHSVTRETTNHTVMLDLIAAADTSHLYNSVTIRPDKATIDYYRDDPNNDWRLGAVLIAGFRVKKGGDLSAVRSAIRYYQGGDQPDWMAELAEHHRPSGKV